MNKKFLTKLVDTIYSLNSKSEINNFLNAILTPKEMEKIPKRLQIVKMLKKGIPQREISEKLGVGIATITRGSKELKNGNFKNIK